MAILALVAGFGLLTLGVVCYAAYRINPKKFKFKTKFGNYLSLKVVITAGGAP